MIDRRHRPPVGLAQLSRRYPRLVLSERIRPEHRLMSSRIPDEPIAPTKGPSSVAVGIVRRAGHGGHDPTTLVNAPLKRRVVIDLVDDDRIHPMLSDIGK